MDSQRPNTNSPANGATAMPRWPTRRNRHCVRADGTCRVGSMAGHGHPTSYRGVVWDKYKLTHTALMWSTDERTFTRLSSLPDQLMRAERHPLPFGAASVETCPFP